MRKQILNRVQPCPLLCPFSHQPRGDEEEVRMKRQPLHTLLLPAGSLQEQGHVPSSSTSTRECTKSSSQGDTVTSLWCSTGSHQMWPNVQERCSGNPNPPVPISLAQPTLNLLCGTAPSQVGQLQPLLSPPRGSHTDTGPACTEPSGGGALGQQKEHKNPFK